MGRSLWSQQIRVCLQFGGQGWAGYGVEASGPSIQGSSGGPCPPKSSKNHMWGQQSASGVPSSVPLTPITKSTQQDAIHWLPGVASGTPLPIPPPGFTPRCSVLPLKLPTPSELASRPTGAERVPPLQWRGRDPSAPLSVSQMSPPWGAASWGPWRAGALSAELGLPLSP